MIRPRQGAAVAACLLLGAGLAAAPAAATRLEVGWLAGAHQPDPSLRDFQFEAAVSPAWGAFTRIGAGPADAGIRVWTSEDVQLLGLASVPDPRARSTHWDATGRWRVGRLFGQRLHVIASAGRMAMTFRPERLTLETGGAPVEVTLSPIHEWAGGAGVGLERSLGSRWAVGLEAEHRWYGMDTARQAGGSTVESRERFGTWDVRVGWSWIHGR